jgi:hypothetical protein
MGGIAMTRRSITTVFASLVVALFITVQSSAASTGPSAVTADQLRFIEINTITLPSEGAESAIGASMSTSAWRFLDVNTLRV